MTSKRVPGAGCRVQGAALLLGSLLHCVVALTPIAATAAEPTIAVWYRGNPAGTPRQSDLGNIRALGFNGVVWPASMSAGANELKRLAAIVGLKVIVADRPVVLNGLTALKPAERVDVAVPVSGSGAMVPLVWRAVANGARVIAFDSGAAVGAGLELRDRSLRPWARTARAIARQLTANANLVDIMRTGPEVTVTPRHAPDLDVVMLDGDRSWVIVATNTSATKVASAVRLPKGTPYALWVSWLEGPPLAMISEPAGPRWMLSLGPRSAAVYIIDKKMK